MKAEMHSLKQDRQADPPQPSAQMREKAGAPPMFDMIEMLFFAYRDFVGDADRLLETYGFGRAHHRVLHFVHRQPGLAIAELLEILKITKQSLNRVLKDLLDQGFVEARPGAQDRRQRQLHATVAGARLAMQLAHVQSQRFAVAFEALGPGSRTQAKAFLRAMIDAAEQPKVAALLERAR